MNADEAREITERARVGLLKTKEHSFEETWESQVYKDHERNVLTAIRYGAEQGSDTRSINVPYRLAEALAARLVTLGYIVKSSPGVIVVDWSALGDDERQEPGGEK